MKYKHVETLIRQLQNRGSGILINSGNKIIINPIKSDEVDTMPQVTINNPEVLNSLLEQYLISIKESDLPFCEWNERIGEKYYLSNVWNNATNYDFDNPERFIKRYTDFILDDTFSCFDEIKCIGSFGLIGGVESYVYIRRDKCPRGYETPFELSFFIGNIEDPATLYPLPKIRYGIENNGGKKGTYVYAIQNDIKPALFGYNDELDNNFREINDCISGMENRGVHSPSFLVAIVLLLGTLRSFNISDVMVPDMLLDRRKNKSRFNNMSEEELDSLQYNLTNKTIKTFIRIAMEIIGVDISAYPNDIDSFLHIKVNSDISSKNHIIAKLLEISKESKEISEQRGTSI